MTSLSAALSARLRLVGVVLVVGLMTFSGRAQAQNTGQTPYVAWMNNLQTQGYTVVPGTETTFGACSSYLSSLGSCFGNNTATPYIFIQPPFATGDYLPNYASQAPYEGTVASGPYSGTNTDDFWQLNLNEAIVTIITLPPQAAYFGFQTYLLERDPTLYPLTYKGTGGPGSQPLPSAVCTPGYKPMTGYSLTQDCYTEVFGYFNNVGVNNADVTAKAYTSSWNTTTAPITYNTIAVITATDSTLADYIKGTFTGNQGTIFIEGMPSVPEAGYPSLYVGKGPTFDTFASVIRVSASQSLSNEQAWAGGGNVLVYRVTQPTTMNAQTYFDAKTVNKGIYKQSANVVENANAAPNPCTSPPVVTSYDGILQHLACQLQAWAAANTPVAAGHSYSVYQAAVPNAYATVAGPSCILYGGNCAGATEDNNYYRNFDIGILQNQYPIFAVGLLHSASTADFDYNSQTTPLNNADYTGISAADYNGNIGAADATEPNAQTEYAASHPILAGSAKAVLMGLLLPDGSGHTIYSSEPQAVIAALPNIYIRAFYRQDSAQQACTEAICLSTNIYTTFIGGLPAGQGNIPDSDPVLLTERGYVLPSPAASPYSLTGALPQLLETPYIVCDTAEPECTNQN